MYMTTLNYYKYLLQTYGTETLAYPLIFSRKRVYSLDLQNKEVLQQYLDKGYKWVKRVEFKHFNQITRYPTIGCTLELSIGYDVGAVEINSVYGRRMIKKLCYF